MNSSRHRARTLGSHALCVTAILLCGWLVYSRISAAYLCSDDDFVETARTAFLDARHPAQMFTTGHFTSFKYRPLNRALNLLTYRLGGGDPRAYRTRNLLCHLVNLALLYVIALLLGKSTLVAAGAALLFAVHPLANQTLVGVVDTNSAAHMFLLLALVIIAAAVRWPAAPRWAVFASAASAFTGLLFYDSGIVGFLILCLYLGFAAATRTKTPLRPFWIRLTVATVCALAVYAGLRHVAVPSAYSSAGAGVPAPSQMVRNAATYAAALLLPLDPVLANRWLGAPFPSEPGFRSGRFGLLLLGAAVLVAIVAAVILMGLRRAPRTGWPANLFLLCCAAVPLAPVLVLNAHASETYVYLPAAFLMLLEVSLFWEWCALKCGVRAAPVFACCIALAAGLFAAATLTRNALVVSCGGTARRILGSVPYSRFASGGKLLFASAPGEEVSRHYGFYGFRGLEAIANRPGFQSDSLRCALRVASGNERLDAEIVDARTLAAFGKAPADAVAAFWVHSDGRISEQAPTGPPR